jgi:hypothetical protein
MVTTIVVPGATLVETAALCDDGGEVVDDPELVVDGDALELELELPL